jgi:16S rRNA (adenine(1408)-N(1))-methyltransferase
MSLELQHNGLTKRLTQYNHIVLDLGTGDGRYVQTLAVARPDWFVIGLDACRENLRERSRARLPNALFVIASAQELPRELHGLVTQVSINFPWGSLMEGLLQADPGLMHGLRAVLQPGAALEVRLNGSALAEHGLDLACGAGQICASLQEAGWLMKSSTSMDAARLRSFPTTWAKRLAYGRDPRALELKGRFAG